jgi:hypothetical protein
MDGIEPAQDAPTAHRRRILRRTCCGPPSSEAATPCFPLDASALYCVVAVKQ